MHTKPSSGLKRKYFCNKTIVCIRTYLFERGSPKQKRVHTVYVHCTVQYCIARVHCTLYSIQCTVQYRHILYIYTYSNNTGWSGILIQNELHLRTLYTQYLHSTCCERKSSPVRHPPHAVFDHIHVTLHMYIFYSVCVYYTHGDSKFCCSHTSSSKRNFDGCVEHVEIWRWSYAAI